MKVPVETYFIEEEIRENLFFGMGLAEVSAGDLARGLRVCRKLGFPDRLLEHVQSKESTVGLMRKTKLAKNQDPTKMRQKKFVFPHLQQHTSRFQIVAFMKCRRI